MGPLLGELLTLLIVLWGFSLMLRPLRSTGGRHSVFSRGGYGRGLGAGLLYMVLLPALWWLIVLLGRLYQRAFIVFTEFLTGVPDWVTYRTSIFKFGGAAFGFVAYNAALVLVFSTITYAAVLQRPSLAGAAMLAAGTAALAGWASRQLMRRSP
jgi:hypothetical protein